MSLETDKKFMQIALVMARRGLGQTSPNPSVGAVIVSNISEPSSTQNLPAKHIILSRAVTGKGGTPHGEPQAIAVANCHDLSGEIKQKKHSQNTEGATLYVTLEPCNHHGRTPPCTEAIIKAGISRVVIASPDPDARVTGGQGVARLRGAGIEVITGVCQQQADQLNAGHIYRQTKNRPFIIVKSAISSDDLVSPAEVSQSTARNHSDNADLSGNKRVTTEPAKTEPKWVTSPLARMRGHLLRAEVDAILIGSNTARSDNPTLTCRLPGMEQRSPQPIILDRELNLPADLTLFSQQAPITPIVITSTKMDEAKLASYKTRNVRIIQIEENSAGQLDLEKLTACLSENEGITRLLIEGGPTIAKNFLEQGLVDQLNIFKGANPAGKGAMLPFLNHPVSWPIDKLGFQLSQCQKLHDNMMSQYNLS